MACWTVAKAEKRPPAPRDIDIAGVTLAAVGRSPSIDYRNRALLDLQYSSYCMGLMFST